MEGSKSERHCAAERDSKGTDILGALEGLGFPNRGGSDSANWRTKFALPLATGLIITLAVSLAVYGIVRAIGWVIGGFASS